MGQFGTRATPESDSLQNQGHLEIDHYKKGHSEIESHHKTGHFENWISLETYLLEILSGMIFQI